MVIWLLLATGEEMDLGGRERIFRLPKIVFGVGMIFNVYYFSNGK